MLSDNKSGLTNLETAVISVQAGTAVQWINFESGQGG